MIAVAIVFGLYLAPFFLPHPLFPHHEVVAGFSLHSDRPISGELRSACIEARHRVDRMELADLDKPPRIFYCHSEQKFRFFVRWAGKKHAGQGLLLAVTGNLFLSHEGILRVRSRHRNGPGHSRMQGSVAAAIAHETAHFLVYKRIGFLRTRSLPAWKAEGYADVQANLASAEADESYDLADRITTLLDDHNWEGPTGSIDRRHFRWHTVVEYLCTVRGLSFEELHRPEILLAPSLEQMLEWHDGREASAPERQ